jgi:hypothetical protein
MERLTRSFELAGGVVVSGNENECCLRSGMELGHEIKIERFCRLGRVRCIKDIACNQYGINLKRNHLLDEPMEEASVFLFPWHFIQ